MAITEVSAAPSRPTLLRMPAVKRETGLSDSHIRALAREGSFPKPIKIGARAVAWRTTDLLSWIEERAAARDAIVTEAAPSPPRDRRRPKNSKRVDSSLAKPKRGAK